MDFDKFQSGCEVNQIAKLRPKQKKVIERLMSLDFLGLRCCYFLPTVNHSCSTPFEKETHVLFCFSKHRTGEIPQSEYDHISCVLFSVLMTCNYLEDHPT